MSSYSNFGPIAPIIKEAKTYIKQNFLQNPSPLQFAFSNFHPAQQNPNLFRPSNQQFYSGPNPNNQIHHHHPHTHSNEVNPTFNYNQQVKHEQKHEQQQQQQLPNLPPSVITPFLEQVHVLQQETANQQRLQQQFTSQSQSNSQESGENSKEYGSFEVINDVYAKNLVPPPQPSLNPNQVAQTYNSILSTLEPSEQPSKVKFNLKMPSPLQDASIFSYSNAGVNAVGSSTTARPSFIKNQEENRFKPTQNEFIASSTQRPSGNSVNLFKNLQRPKDDVYKQHKLLHPAYGKKRPGANEENEEKKPFLPTPYRPEKEESSEEQEPFGVSQRPTKLEPTRSFFTIEDAMTQLPTRLYKKPTQTPLELPDTFTLSPFREYDTEFPATVGPTLTPAPVSTSPQQEEQSTTVRPRQKLRRRRPKPQQKKVLENQIEEEKPEQTFSPRPKVNRSRTTSTTSAPESEISRPRTRFPSRSRTRPLTRTPAPNSVETDTTAKISEEPATSSTEFESKFTSSATDTTEPENVKHRIRLRYKNKVVKPDQSLDIGDFNANARDNLESNTQLENVVIRGEDEEQTTFNSVTENSQNNVRSSLRLPNLNIKLGGRNEDLTTLPSVSLGSGESEEKASNKTNRPRFSVKDYRKKVTSSGSTTVSSTTLSTTPKPDSQRFNRFRFQSTKKRNETTDDPFDTSKRKVYLTKYYTTSTAPPPTTTIELETTLPPHRPLRKRIPFRNQTRYSGSEENDAQHLRPMIKNFTTLTQNRPPTINLRQRIQGYNKKKENEEISNFLDTNKNLNNLSSELLATTVPATTTTETYKHETSIMKIAKSSSHHSSPLFRSTTNNILKDFKENTENVLDDFDLTGSPSEHSKRVAELTISGNLENSSFKSVNMNVKNGLLSRKIPNYFTISTDDPVLPIQAFFPQIKTNVKDVSMEINKIFY